MHNDLDKANLKSFPQHRRRLFVSIAVRVLVAFFVTFSVIAALQSIWYLTVTLKFTIDRVQAGRIDLIRAAKNGLNLEEVLTLARDGKPNAQGFSDDPRYTHIMGWLDTIHQLSPTAWPYVFVPGQKSGEIINLVDLSAKYMPGQAKKFLQSETLMGADDKQIAADTFMHINAEGFHKGMLPIPPPINQYFGENNPVHELINQINMSIDNLGNWISIYSYIRDDQGRVIAGIGLDNENSLVSSLGLDTGRQLIISFLGSLLIMLLVGLRLGSIFTKPIVRLTKAAEIINAGDHQNGLEQLEKAGNQGKFMDEIDRLIETIRKLVNFQHALYTISAAANKTSDLNKLYSLTYRKVSDLIRAEVFSIALYNAETKMISLYRMTSLNASDCEALQMEYPLGSPPDLIGYVIQTGQSMKLLKKEYKALITANVVENGPGFAAWLGVPLLGDDQKIFGALTAQSYEKNANFSENDKALFSFIAAQLGMIIKRSRAETELRQSYQLLEQRVQDRTSDLQELNTQLVKEISERQHIETEMARAKDAAEAANIAKSVFLANMSHELRTPLSAILGFSNLMTHDPNLPAHQKEDLDIILQSGEHLLDLINDVLEMSKIEAGRNTLNPASFDLRRLLQEVEEIFRSRTGEKGLSLIFDVEPNLPQYIHTDEKKLRQVFLNLLSNAIKFTENGGVTLRSRLKEKISKNEVRLVFEVEDTGQGVSNEEKKDLFNYFVQTDAGKKSQEGTGLGLSISKNFIQMMGGNITVESELGKGSIFSFDICVGLSDGDDVLHAVKDRKVIGLEPDQSTWRILIVEDRDANRKLLAKLLQPFGSQNGGPGFLVREAVNGRQALEVWEDWEPDLIFMDMRMPEMNGHDATRRIRESIKGHSVVIIALTASAFEEERKLILSEGIDDFIRKPFKESEIFGALSKYLGARFVYADEAADHSSTSETPGLNSVLVKEKLSEMPPGWLSELKQAASAADGERIGALLQRIQPENSQLVGALEGFMAQYRYDLILNLLPVYD